MPKQIETPNLSEELIDYLDTLFPEKCAELNQYDKEIFYQAGQSSVVKHLIEKFKIQKEN